MPTDYATLRADPVLWERKLARGREWNIKNRERKREYMKRYNREYNRLPKPSA